MTVALSRGEDRAILTALGAVASLTAADAGSRCWPARGTHASSWFLLQDGLGPGLGALFSAARSAGVSTSLDTNWDPSGRWAGPHLSAAIGQAGLLLPNEAEAMRLAGADDLDVVPSRPWSPPGRGWWSASASGERCARTGSPGSGLACRR